MSGKERIKLLDVLKNSQLNKIRNNEKQQNMDADFGAYRTSYLSNITQVSCQTSSHTLLQCKHPKSLYYIRLFSCNE